MSASAIVMLVVGSVVLYGGLAWCLVLAIRRRDHSAGQPPGEKRNG